MSRTLFEIEGLRHSYGAQEVLKGISACIRSGEVVGVLGPNGAGKTTLLRILCGLLAGWKGRVRFQERPLGSWKQGELARRLAYVPQQTHMVFPYTVREVVLMGRIPHQDGSFFESRRDHEQVERALDLTDSLHLADRFFGDLSGGERQLVVLASALAQEPEVLMLDEPTIFLDLKHQLEIYRILRDLHRRQGITLVVVTHDLNLAQAFCHRLLLLRQGIFLADLRREDEGRGPTLSDDLIEALFDVRVSSELVGTTRKIVVSLRP